MRDGSVPSACAMALLGLLATAPPAFAVAYVESSQGLIPPTLERGRTEVEFADVDQDGHVDLVSIGDHGSPFVNTDQHGIMVWFGDGQGAWSVHQSGDFGYGGIALGDLNGDGLTDAAYGMHHDYASGDFGDQIIEAVLGDGTGRNWTPWDDGLATSGEDYGMFGTDLADVDNDGDLDIGSISFGCCSGVHVYENRGDGTWAQLWGFLGGNAAQDLLFGDVNADGFADVVSAHASGTVWLGDGTGGFTNADGNLPSGGTTGRQGPSLGDIDDDGDLDIAFRGSNGSLQVWLWNGPGAWVSASTGLPTSGVQATQIADMDGDDRLDLVVIGSASLQVWVGNGGTVWTRAVMIPLATPGYFAALRAGGDVDHNGLPDIAVVDEEGPQFSSRNKFHVFREASAPVALTARFTRPRGGERLMAGSAQFIDWAAAVPGPDEAVVGIDLSTSGPGGPWTPVGEGLPNSGRHQWQVPLVPPTDQAYLRLRVTAGAETVEAVTPRVFSILSPNPTSVEAGLPGGPAAAMDRASFAWPNPSRGAVRLRFAGSAPGAEVEIFTVDGRMVRGLTAVAPDRKEVVWDGRTDTGLPAASGVYVARCGPRTLHFRVVR